MIVVGVSLQIVSGLKSLVADFADVLGPDEGIADGDYGRGDCGRDDGRLLLDLDSGVLLAGPNGVMLSRRRLFFAIVALTRY